MRREPNHLDGVNSGLAPLTVEPLAQFTTQRQDFEAYWSGELVAGLPRYRPITVSPTLDPIDPRMLDPIDPRVLELCRSDRVYEAAKLLATLEVDDAT